MPAYRLAYSLNLRRDLDAGQRALMVLESWDKYKADAKERMAAGGRGGTSATPSKARDDAAEDAGVSPRTMQDAITVKEQGSKKLQRDVLSGKVSAKAAANAIRDEAIRELLATCPKTIREKVDSGAIDPTDAEIKRLASLNEDDQTAVARAIRVGQAKTLSEGFTQCKITKAPPKAKPKATPASTAKGDYGKCPNCAGIRWSENDDGVVCARCNHPHGEPAGEVDGDRANTQRLKTIKTVEALMRAFDDLQMLLGRPEHDEAIRTCKLLLKMAKGWK